MQYGIDVHSMALSGGGLQGMAAMAAGMPQVWLPAMPLSGQLKTDLTFFFNIKYTEEKKKGYHKKSFLTGRMMFFLSILASDFIKRFCHRKF